MKAPLPRLTFLRRLHKAEQRLLMRELRQSRRQWARLFPRARPQTIALRRLARLALK